MLNDSTTGSTGIVFIWTKYANTYKLTTKRKRSRSTVYGVEIMWEFENMLGEVLEEMHHKAAQVPCQLLFEYLFVFQV